MAAIPTDGVVSSSWARPRSRYRTRSRSPLNLVVEGFLCGLRPPLSRRQTFERFGDSRDMLGRVAAASAGNVDQPRPCKIAQIAGHVLRPQIEPCLRQRI